MKRKVVTSTIEKRASGKYSFIASTGDVDRDSDVIDPAGWQLSQYRKNPVILWAHDHKAPPIGRAARVEVERGALVVDVEFAGHQFAQEIRQLVDEGFVKAVSVGFRPIQSAYNHDRGGFDFSQTELLEVSLVPIPANAGALRRAVKSGRVQIDSMSPAALKLAIRALVRDELRQAGVVKSK